MNLRYAAGTDVGVERQHNEDHFAVVAEERLFLVADGMGGHAAGEVAAQLAIDAITAFYRQGRASGAVEARESGAVRWSEQARLLAAVRSANQRVHQESSGHDEHHGMGTTIVVAVFEEDRVSLAHVGDSRIYRLRQGQLQQLTRDHSLLEELKRFTPGMTEAEEHAFQGKNVITRALGIHGTVDVATAQYGVEAGDQYLLCTDGLSGMVDDATMANVILGAGGLEEAVAQLIECANRAGGVDNITAVLIECVEETQ